MLRDLEFEPDYSRDNCPDLVGKFFVPALSHSVYYDRTTYTFGPEALVVAAAGLAGLINNGGRMRLICHHELPKEVVQAVLNGQRAAEDALLDSVGELDLATVRQDDLQRFHNLELLTWLVKQHRLEIKVAIPKSGQGIFHRKVGVFTDSNRDRVAFDGSLNESAHGWLYNDEHVSVFTSWDNAAHLGPLANGFETLWENKADSSIVIPIPEALRQSLIKFAPDKNPAGPDKNVNEGERQYQVNRERRAELWRAIHYAIAHDSQTSIATTAAELWPHQLSFWRRYGRDAETPPRVLIADEVGLGKTIQAGAVLKNLVNRGQAARVLILTPAVARWQWQQELQHKFNLDLPVLDRQGAQMHLAWADGRREPVSETPWHRADRLILSYDWLRRHMKEFRADAPEYDMVIFDEAHHARYLEVSNPQRKRENSYLQMLQYLGERSKGLMLLTATPMQIDPSELWALLQALDATGQWNEAEFRRFYDTNAQATLDEWDALRQVYTRNGLPGSTEELAVLARMNAGEAREHLSYIQMSSAQAVVLRRNLTAERIRESMSFMRRSSSVKRLVSRHTRNLLRQYAARGAIQQTVPERDVQSIPVTMREEEQELYDGIRDLVRECYENQVGVNRQAQGFVMTHFRLRLGSCLYAFQQSLMDLQRRLQGDESVDDPWEDLPIEEDDEYSDVDPEAAIPAPKATPKRRQMLAELLQQCNNVTSPDTKYVELLNHLSKLRADGYKRVMVFSRFKDTQTWLRQQLAEERLDGFLGGLSGQEDWVYRPDSRSFQPADRDKVVGGFRGETRGILLCTDTAAESLNFQFCSAIINYDIPWNPMRLEQRIGRIDRIGQERSHIRVVHLFYRDSVEYDAYTAMRERIEEFQENVGVLQPILTANLESIIRKRAIGEDSSANIADTVRSIAPSMGFDLDDLAADAADQQDPPPLLGMDDLTYILNHPDWLPDGYSAVPAGDRHWLLSSPSGSSMTVTTDRWAHDYAAGAVGFFGPGNPLFPEAEVSSGNNVKAPARSIKDILGEGLT